MKIRYLRSQRAVSEVISTILLLVISIFGASVLAIFVNDFFDAGIFSQTNFNNPQNLFLAGYDTRDGSNLYGIAEIDNACNLVANNRCDSAILDGGSEYVVLAIENKGVSQVHINNIFINEIQHTWDSQTNGKTTVQERPSSGKFSLFLSLNSRTQVAPDIPSGKIGYVVLKLNSALESLENKKLVHLRVDERGLDSQEFVIRIGIAT